jgi:hypothetical protein
MRLKISFRKLGKHCGQTSIKFISPTRARTLCLQAFLSRSGVTANSFSRPPRYDHFGNPPCKMLLCIITKSPIGKMATIKGNASKNFVASVPPKPYKIKVSSEGKV